MITNCLAHSKNASCFIADSLSPLDGTVIAASVGAGGANILADARTIQAALNDVPSGRGGPSPPLTVDGIVGPKTIAAIKRFQQTHGTVIDSRIDPNQRTLAALNAELNAGMPVLVRRGAADAPRRRRVPEFLPPDPEINVLVLSLLAEVRALILAADFQLTVADRFVTSQKLVIPTDSLPFQVGVRQSLSILDRVFSLGKFTNPRPPFDNIKRVFRNMVVALNRTFQTTPLIAPVLFVPNTHISMETKASAYTTDGAAFLSSKDRIAGINEPADRIYICRNALTLSRVEQARILVHELAHFVSGQPIRIVDPVKEFSMLNPASRKRFDAIRPEQKVRSAEHYAFFALASRSPSLL